MTEQDIRLECLKLAVPRDIATPDTDRIITRAREYEAYVLGSGHSQADPPKRRGRPPKSPDTSQDPGSVKALIETEQPASADT